MHAVSSMGKTGDGQNRSIFNPLLFKKVGLKKNSFCLGDQASGITFNEIAGQFAEKLSIPQTEVNEKDLK